ncbi:Secretoglobin [Hexamita inflata]|uniref:Secretoglobin n=2 Tax=Hexamita inflata TaxID=28002 RepID=A0AA86NLR5_9EUKA|nr:Secretoglobin [Hexamita inflata]
MYQSDYNQKWQQCAQPKILTNYANKTSYEFALSEQDYQKLFVFLSCELKYCPKLLKQADGSSFPFNQLVIKKLEQTVVPAETNPNSFFTQGRSISSTESKIESIQVQNETIYVPNETDQIIQESKSIESILGTQQSQQNNWEDLIQDIAGNQSSIQKDNIQEEQNFNELNINNIQQFKYEIAESVRKAQEELIQEKQQTEVTNKIICLSDKEIIQKMKDLKNIQLKSVVVKTQSSQQAKFQQLFRDSVKQILFDSYNKKAFEMNDKELCEVLNEYIKKFYCGQLWTTLQKMIPVKTITQLKEYYQKSFQKCLYSDSISLEDKVILRELISQMPLNKPCEVADRFLEVCNVKNYFKRNIIMYIVNIKKKANLE